MQGFLNEFASSRNDLASENPENQVAITQGGKQEGLATSCSDVPTT